MPPLIISTATIQVLNEQFHTSLFRSASSWHSRLIIVLLVSHFLLSHPRNCTSIFCLNIYAPPLFMSHPFLLLSFSKHHCVLRSSDGADTEERCDEVGALIFKVSSTPQVVAHRTDYFIQLGTHGSAGLSRPEHIVKPLDAHGYLVALSHKLRQPETPDT